jgi:hypothetical protein
MLMTWRKKVELRLYLIFTCKLKKIVEKLKIDLIITYTG